MVYVALGVGVRERKSGVGCIQIVAAYVAIWCMWPYGCH